MALSIYTGIYIGGIAVSLLVCTRLWLSILQIPPTMFDILSSFTYNLFPAFVWPVSLPLTCLAYTFVTHPDMFNTCRSFVFRTPDVPSPRFNLEEKTQRLHIHIRNFKLKKPEKDIYNTILNLDDQTKCTICLETLKVKMRKKKTIPRALDVCLTSCCHGFHYGCLYNWLIKDRSCPVCRYDQEPEKLRFVYKQPLHEKVSQSRRSFRHNRDFYPGHALRYSGTPAHIQTLSYSSDVDKEYTGSLKQKRYLASRFEYLTFENAEHLCKSKTPSPLPSVSPSSELVLVASGLDEPYFEMVNEWRL